MKGKRIYILCEGDTEENAIRYFIRPQWDKIDDLKSIALDYKTIKPKDIHKQTKLLIENNDCNVVFILFDLYGFQQELKGNSFKEKRKYIIDKLKTNSEYANLFFPHFAIHEIESWILTDGDALSAYLKSRVAGENNAEEIDFDNYPSKRLNYLFLKLKKRRYYKNTDSTALFKKLDFKKVYDNCHYFRTFYDELKNVGEKIKQNIM